jgi:hypothetical protein
MAFAKLCLHPDPQQRPHAQQLVTGQCSCQYLSEHAVTTRAKQQRQLQR